MAAADHDPPATWAVVTVTAATGSFAAEGTTAKPSDGVVLRAKIAEDNLDQLGRPAGVGSRRRDPHVLGTVGRA